MSNPRNTMLAAKAATATVPGFAAVGDGRNPFQD